MINRENLIKIGRAGGNTSNRETPDQIGRVGMSGWGHLITWNGSMMGHLNSFSASGGGGLNKNFPKIQMPGGLPGGDVEASI